MELEGEIRCMLEIAFSLEGIHCTLVMPNVFKSDKNQKRVFFYSNGGMFLYF